MSKQQPGMERVEITYAFKPIGVIRSCFKEKFGVPRQPGILPDVISTLELHSPYDRPEAFVELEGFSHIWVIFVFHQTQREQWRPTVRPPRLGGNRRIGVFASRAPYRPNPIGLSVVALDKIECLENKCVLYLRGADLVDGTPVLDIKPYVPYVDAVKDAIGGFAAEMPVPSMPVVFSEKAALQCAQREKEGITGLRQLIEQTLALDPRPAYVAGGEEDAVQQFGMRLYDFDLKWQVRDGQAEVLELCSLPEESRE